MGTDLYTMVAPPALARRVLEEDGVVGTDG